MVNASNDNIDFVSEAKAFLEEAPVDVSRFEDYPEPPYKANLDFRNIKENLDEYKQVVIDRNVKGDPELTTELYDVWNNLAYVRDNANMIRNKLNKQYMRTVSPAYIP